LRDADERVRRAAAARLLELDRQPADPRAVRLLLVLADPALEARFGPLDLRVEVRTSEQRYALEPPGGGYPPARGRVVTEHWEAKVLKADGSVVAEKSFHGAKGRKAQAFDDRYPVRDGSYIMYNAAGVKLEELCMELVRDADRDFWTALAGSGDKYLRSAADALLHP
jgi:hypothetical protein